MLPAHKTSTRCCWSQPQFIPTPYQGFPGSGNTYHTVCETQTVVQDIQQVPAECTTAAQQSNSHCKMHSAETGQLRNHIPTVRTLSSAQQELGSGVQCCKVAESGMQRCL